MNQRYRNWLLWPLLALALNGCASMETEEKVLVWSSIIATSIILSQDGGPKKIENNNCYAVGAAGQIERRLC